MDPGGHLLQLNYGGEETTHRSSVKMFAEPFD